MSLSSTYQSREELASFQLHNTSSLPHRTNSELYSLLKSQLRASHTGTLIAFYTRNDEIYIYNTKEQKHVHLITEIKAVHRCAFINATQLAVSSDYTISIYDLELKRVTKSVTHELDSPLMMVTMNENVLINGFSEVIVWNTVTNELRKQEFEDYSCVEIVPISKTEIIVCHDKPYVSLTDIWFTSVTKVDIQAPKILSTDRYADDEIVLLYSNQIIVFNVKTKEKRHLMNTESVAHGFYIKMAHDNLIVAGSQNATSVWNLTSKRVVQEELCKPDSSTYLPFQIKGSLLCYFEGDKIYLIDTKTMKEVCTYEAPVNGSENEGNLAIW